MIPEDKIKVRIFFLIVIFQQKTFLKDCAKMTKLII